MANLNYRVTAIRLENFMGFEDTDWIELRPITLLFGRNSSGKSAIIRALLMLKQSIEQRNPQTPLVLTGEYVDLGTFYNVVRGHDTKLIIRIGFRIEPVPDEEFPKPMVGQSAGNCKKRIDEWGLRREERQDSARLGRDRDAWLDNLGLANRRVEFILGFGTVHEASLLFPDMVSVEIIGQQIHAHDSKSVVIFRHCYDGDELEWKRPNSDLSSIEQKGAFDNEIWRHINYIYRSGLVPSVAFSDEADRSSEISIPFWDAIAGAFDFLGLHIGELVRGLIYLRPLRDEARRYYLMDKDWVRGLLDVKNESSELLNVWLQTIMQDTSIQVKSLRSEEGANEGIVSVYLLDGHSGIYSNLRDVGAGISQALPIIVHSLQAGRDSLIIVEQPELHLHPGAQVALADLFVDICDFGARFLIETHSEHFLLRWQRRIAETSIELYDPDLMRARNDHHGLNKDQVLVNFISKVNGISSVERIHLDYSGRVFALDPSGTEKDTSDTFNRFFSVDYEDARLLGCAMSELLSAKKDRP